MQQSEDNVDEPWLELFWEHSDDAALWVVKGIVRSCNHAAERLLGPDGNGMSGRPLDELCNPTAGEVTISSPSGEDEVYTVRRTPARSDHAELVILQDITANRRLEQSLRERNAQLQSTLESIPFDFWMNDLENRTILQNSYSRDLWGNQAGHHVWEVTDDARILAYWEDSNQRALQGETVVGELTYRIDGTDRVFRNIVAPVRLEQEIIGILGLNVEISDLKHALADRDTLLKELHHLVRNDLQIILSAMNLHRSGGQLSAPQVLQRVEHQIHALCLVHDQLYAGGPLSTVDLSDVAVRVAPRCPVNDPGGPVLCSLEQAIPIAILLTELLSILSATARRPGNNPSDAGGGPAIDIVRTTDGGILMVISEGSAGHKFSDPVTPEDFTVVQGLVAQLNGTFTVETSPSFRIAVTIPA